MTQKSNLAETDKEMTCDNCGNRCPVYSTRGVVLDNLLYLAKCWKCGCFYTSEDGLHWSYQWQMKPESLIQEEAEK